MIDIDEIDEQLISQLQRNGRISVTDLSKRLKLARTTVQARIERLENADVIAGYGIRFGEQYKAGRIRATMLAEITSRETSQIIAYLRGLPEVERVHTTSGRFDLIIEVAVRDLARLDEIIDDIENREGFEDSETLVHLSTRLDRRV